MKRAGGVWALAFVLGWGIAGIAWADSPRQPQNPDPNRPGRLVGHPPWAKAAPAPQAAPPVRRAPVRRVQETPAPMKKHEASKTKHRPEHMRAPKKQASRPALWERFELDSPQTSVDPVRTGVLGLASAAGFAVVVMGLVASFRRKAPI